MNAESSIHPNLQRKRGGRRPVPTVLQMEATECGAACLAMVLARYGRWAPLEELRVRCGVSRDGSKAGNVLRAAREYGLFAQGYRRDLGRLFDLPFPMIVFWNFNHFIVLEGIRGDTVYINDPGQGPRRISMQEFDEGFTGVCLAFAPGPEFRREGSPPSVMRGLLSRPRPCTLAALLRRAGDPDPGGAGPRHSDAVQGIRGRRADTAQRGAAPAASDRPRNRRRPAGGPYLAAAQLPRPHGDQALARHDVAPSSATS